MFDLQHVASAEPGSSGDIMMKDGDRIMVPRRAQEVSVLGEVQTMTSHLFREGLSRDDYIALSGGTTQKADKSRIYVVRADGSVDPVGQRVVRPLGRRDTAGRHDRRAARRRADASTAAVDRRHADHLPDGDRSRGCELVLTSRTTRAYRLAN